jgi:hypothetical protein
MKGHDKHFTVPVLDQSVSISAGLLLGSALCQDAGAAERPQEILYPIVKKFTSISIVCMFHVG